MTPQNQPNSLLTTAQITTALRVWRMTLEDRAVAASTILDEAGQPENPLHGVFGSVLLMADAVVSAWEYIDETDHYLVGHESPGEFKKARAGAITLLEEAAR